MRPLVVKPCLAALVTGVVAVLVTGVPAATGLGIGIAGASSNPAPSAPGAPSASAAPAAATVTTMPGRPTVQPGAPRFPAAPARPRAVPRCTVRQLGVGFRGLSPGAGQRALTLVLSNMSHSTCSVRGYPGLQFHGAAGRALATHETRIRGPRPMIVLRSRNSVRSCLRWSAISPPFIHPRVIAVAPPGDHSALVVAWQWGPVFKGNISVTAIMKHVVCS